MNHRFQHKLVNTSCSLAVVFLSTVGKCWKIHQQTSTCPPESVGHSVVWCLFYWGGVGCYFLNTVIRENVASFSSWMGLSC